MGLKSVLVTLIVTLLNFWSQPSLAGFEKCEALVHFKPENTQMNISTPSGGAQRLGESLKGMGCGKCKILDYGAGNGRNSAFLESLGYDLVSYDPVPNPKAIFRVKNDFSRNTRFDGVLSSFVFNVLPPKARLELAENLDQLKWTVLVIESRAPQRLDKQAKIKGWAKFEDGYISSATRQTFQVGLSPEDLLALPLHRKRAEIIQHSADTSIVIFYR